MGRSPCCEKVGLKKGTWTPEEDQKLLAYIERHGHGSWRALPAKAGLLRCGKSCRLRWTNYLRPDIKRGKFSLQEEQTIIQLHALLGNRWSAIATHLPKRTDNEIKNCWNTHLKKRLIKMGIDPTTHKPKTSTLASGQQKDTANLSHMAQWESARLEAESRLVRESKLIMSTTTTTMATSPRFGDPIMSALHQSLNKVRVPIVSQPEPMVLPCLDVLKAWQGTWTTKNSTNGFFNPNGTLQSPTSTLHFSNNIFATSSATCFSDNLPFSTTNYVENPKPYEEGLTKENGPNNNNNNVMQLNELDYPIDATYEGSPSFVEGFVDASGGQDSNDVPIGSFHDLDGSCGGDLEDNRKYWNNMLNLENSTTSGSNVLFY